MQSVNDIHQTNSLTDGPVKPVCYSVTEKQQASPKTPKKPISYKKNLPLTSFEKAYNFFTSLPVSSALLALIVSQGASINNSMWYINYLALAFIFLTCIAVGISYLSVPASHRFCESVFLTIYTPARQVLNISVSLHDSHDEDIRPKNKLPEQGTTSSWMKLALLISAVAAASRGLTVFSAFHVSVMTFVYHSLSVLLSKVYLTDDKTSNDKRWQTSDLTAAEYAKALLISLVIVLDICCFGAVSLCCLLYFLTVDSTVQQITTNWLENRNIEVMEGLEKHFAEGVIRLAEVVIVLAALVVEPYICLLYFAVFYFNIYLPIVTFRQTVAKIRGESLCLSNFPKASASDLRLYDDVCAVCLCSMKYARLTPCKHIFHGKCLKDCLSKKAQCPMCNAQVL